MAERNRFTPVDDLGVPAATATGKRSPGGLCLVEGRTDLAISRHANTDPAYIRGSRGGFHAVNAFGLAAPHLFGHRGSDANRAKGPCEREARQEVMHERATQAPAVLREFARMDFTQEPDADRARSVIAKTAEDTDSALTDWCEPSLAGRLEYAPGLGFHLYNPSRGTWEADGPKDSAKTLRLVEEVLRERHLEIVASGDSKRAQRDRKNLNKGKIEAVTRLLRGRLLHEADEYDSDPDILNVAHGVVDLRTRKLHPHAASYRCTQYTPVPYRPDAIHEDWTAALAALPADSHPPGSAGGLARRLPATRLGKTTPCSVSLRGLALTVRPPCSRRYGWRWAPTREQPPWTCCSTAPTTPTTRRWPCTISASY